MDNRSPHAAKLCADLSDISLYQTTGRVTQIVGSTIHATIASGRIGELCRLRDPSGGQHILAEIIGFSKGHAVLTPMGDIRGLSTRTEVVPLGQFSQMPVSDDLLGRVVDSFGQPMDGGHPIHTSQFDVIHKPAPDPMKRDVIAEPLACGVRAIDAFLTCGQGQRIGIYGEAGGGKSTLMSSIVKGCAADVCVIGMIGERGREVREFVEHHLGPEAMQKTVVVVSTSDRPAGERVMAAFAATTVAEYFRDQGKRVLLLMDSLTRFARAQREIGLAAGEMPTRRGFPISVFTMLPNLLERAGPGMQGSITAFYTVLVEGDGTGDPIADETRGILDGHLILSAKLGAENHYPAIDIMRSKSRLMTTVTSPDHINAAGYLRDLMATYDDIALLVKVGEYTAGSDPRADQALATRPLIKEFLKQRTDEFSSFDNTLDALRRIADATE
ncbi:FliI/YscN family ATPase [Parasulfitobacter algicola]|uniref:FliI/YscN family ATPase n=1 Tax=Parasulfitobacter algicola TaxID=2614809 RepID=A0ABX2IV15_9RHOB|nr:FliI/YscN family ATPase [Sulfitobacter algicola]NSX56761.1 FliI/YscN family ATPase [Sulfitobacter algicola]